MQWFYLAESVVVMLAAALFASTRPRLPALPRARRRLVLFDVLKGLSIVMIVALHASEVFARNSFVKELLWGAIAAFIFASGYLLGYRYERVEWKSYLKGIWWRIVLIYALFVVVTHIFVNHGLSLRGVVLDLLLGRTNGNYYFIPLLLQFYVLFPFLSRVREWLRKPWALALIGGLSFFFHVLTYFAEGSVWNSDRLALVFCGRYLIFFVMGVVVSDRDLSKDAKRWLPLLGVVVFQALFFSWWGGKAYLGYLWPLGSILLLVLVAGVLPASLQALFSTLGKHSLIIYLVHTRLLFSWLLLLPWDPLLVFAVSVVVATAISYAFSRVFMYGYGYLLKRVKR